MPFEFPNLFRRNIGDKQSLRTSAEMFQLDTCRTAFCPKYRRQSQGDTLDMTSGHKHQLGCASLGSMQNNEKYPTTSSCICDLGHTAC